MMVWEYFTHFHKSALCYTDVHVYRATSQGILAAYPPGKILKSGPLRMHKKQELEFLNRTQTSLNFFLFSDRT